MDTIVCSNLVQIDKLNLNFDIISSSIFDGKVWNGKWIRTNKFPDDEFTTWVTDEDLKNPLEWMIFFGLVKKEMVEGAYLLNKAKLSMMNKVLSNIDKKLFNESKKTSIFSTPFLTSYNPLFLIKNTV